MGRSVDRVPGAVLAAGGGSRFRARTGRNKLLVPVAGEPLVRHSVRAMLYASHVAPVGVVVGCEAERVLDALGGLRRHPHLEVVENERWAEGLATSLRAVLEHLPGEVPGLVVLPGDMPFMTPALIDRVVERFLTTHKACFPIHRGRKGHPTVLPRTLFPALRRLQGDAGARAVLTALPPSAVELLPLTPSEALTQQDVDVPDDLS